ncbi:MAG: hypothetical protein IKZ31_03935, partial [Lentisphaeria bacterium]|nr:hypothetical protein [Lentisphaeria bacterium]
MSRYVVFLLMFCAALGAVAGNLVPENGSFEKWNGNAPAGFSINTVFKNWQVSAQKGGTYDGASFMRVVTLRGNAACAVMGGMVPASCGDKVSLSCAVRGKGRMRFEIYCYDAQGRWVGKNVESGFFNVDTDQWLVEKFDGILPAAEGVKFPVRKVRAVLFTAAGSTLDF